MTQLVREPRQPVSGTHESNSGAWQPSLPSSSPFTFALVNSEYLTVVIRTCCCYCQSVFTFLSGARTGPDVQVGAQ